MNAALVRQPFVQDDTNITLDYDLLAFHQAVRNNEPRSLAKAPTEIHIVRTDKSYIDFNEWCREVVWWGNKKGAYLYTSQIREKQLAGHF